MKITLDNSGGEPLRVSDIRRAADLLVGARHLVVMAAHDCVGHRAVIDAFLDAAVGPCFWFPCQAHWWRTPDRVTRTIITQPTDLSLPKYLVTFAPDTSVNRIVIALVLGRHGGVGALHTLTARRPEPGPIIMLAGTPELEMAYVTIAEGLRSVAHGTAIMPGEN